jgi:Mitochondrial carrier protein
MQYRSQRADCSNAVKLGRRATETAGRAVAHVWSDDRQDPVFLYSSLVAGILSGTASAVVCAPLDLVRTRLQVWGDVIGTLKKGEGPSSRWFLVYMFRDIVRNEGVAGCFRGLTATLLTVPAFWGVYCEFTSLERRSIN